MKGKRINIKVNTTRDILLSAHEFTHHPGGRNTLTYLTSQWKVMEQYLPLNREVQSFAIKSGPMKYRLEPSAVKNLIFLALQTLRHRISVERFLPASAHSACRLDSRWYDATKVQLAVYAASIKSLHKLLTDIADVYYSTPPELVLEIVFDNSTYLYDKVTMLVDEWASGRILFLLNEEVIIDEDHDGDEYEHELTVKDIVRNSWTARNVKVKPAKTEVDKDKVEALKLEAAKYGFTLVATKPVKLVKEVKEKAPTRGKK